MEKYDIYSDISKRTNGDIFIGVVGPVRTGKSTFITKFMENFVIPNISNKLQKQIATDEMPQSASGKTVMTTEPKFIPSEAINIQFKSKVSAKIRLIDCVGYMVDGVNGVYENDKERLVKTPWSKEEIPFSKASNLGTNKVINDYSTIGIMITCDGSFTDIPRENYVVAEEKTVSELKNSNKPFIIILNCQNPQDEKSILLASSLQEKYDVSVVPLNVQNISSNEIDNLMEKVLLEFPISVANIDIPKWMQVLPESNKMICEIIENVKKCSQNMSKMKDYNQFFESFNESEIFNSPEVKDINLSCGESIYNITAKNGVFYNALSNVCGETISDDCDLMKYINGFAESKQKFNKIKDALIEAEETGYGIVVPKVDEMNLEEPVLVKQGGRYGVKLKATAPSLHIMKVDVSTEVSPIVGNAKQGEDLISFIENKFEDNPQGIWETNMFGKSLHDLVKDGMQEKINSMPKDAQGKMRKTITRIVNENRGGVICILL